MKPSRHFFISVYGWTYWAPILLLGGLLSGVFLIVPGLWPLAGVTGVVTLACLAFFRDFHRRIPGGRGLMLAPADGKITEITRLEHYEPLNGPALRLGIFLSVLDVHVNRSPCEAVVLAVTYKEGLFLDARHTEAGLKNQSATLVLGSPEAADHHPVAVVRQIVGAIARRIICPVVPGERLAPGERFGMIAFGSRTELIVPNPDQWDVAIALNQHVNAGTTILLKRR